MKSVLIDLTGMRFGRLTVIGRVEDHIYPSGKHRPKWKCKCDCGNEIETTGNNLKNGDTKSCGCAHHDMLVKRNYKHGISDRHPIYYTWCRMKERCYRENDKNYAHYGGRGITICVQWKNDFKSFYDWSINNGWAPKLSIDRIDNDGPYCPENCRWVDHKIQMNNTRLNRHLSYGGETHTMAEWSLIKNIPYDVLKHRLYKGWPLEYALDAPLNSKLKDLISKDRCSINTLKDEMKQSKRRADL